MHYLYRTLYPIVRKLLTGLLIKQLSQGSADIAGAARLGCAFSLWGMVGHRLNAEATWAGEAVQDD